jgi:DNA repair exonuclease SbcCD ATPase subunit
MKLKLYNFKCYEEEEFIIPEKGLVLISAPSGSGKSTILEGILFALFGTGKKLPTWGKKSCKVELEYKDLLITRTKVPNHLGVIKNNVLFEDDSGQSIIDELFGEVFQTSSFVDNHNLHKSFILMSPIDKLMFLEKFALQEINLVDIKNKTKEKTKRLHQDLISSQNRLSTAEEILKEIEPPKKIEFPFRKTNSTTETKLIKNEEIRYKNTKILTVRAEKNIKALELKLKNAEMSQLTKNQLEREIRSITEKINSLNISIGKININISKHEELERVLKYLVQNRNVISLERSIKELENRIKESVNREKEELKNSIANIKKSITEKPKDLENSLGTLYQQKSKAESNDKIIKELTEYKDICEKDLEDYREEFVKVKEKVENKRKLLEQLRLSQEFLFCPKCEASLTLEYEKEKPKLVHNPEADLYLEAKNSDTNKSDVKTEIDESIEIIENEIKELNKNIQYLRKTIIEDTKRLFEKNDLTEKLEVLKKYFLEHGIERINLKKIQEDIQTKTNLLNSTNNSIDKLQELERAFKNEKFSSTIVSMKKELLIEKEKYEKIKGTKNEKIKGNEEEIQQRLIKEKLLIQEYDIHKKQLKNLESELEVKNTQLKNIEKESIGSIKKNIENSEKEFQELKVKLEIHQENVEKINKYETYRKEIDKYTQIKNKVKNLTREEIESGKKLNAINILKQKILESESIAVHRVIDSINTYASNYLELFFPDDPITVSLLCFKEAKNKKSEKPQINIRIIYKNEECDITSLSGGELSRLVLAFTLALGEMFNTPTLLLDECTASLDQVNTQNVFESIKQNFSNRLVLAIAHQVVEGSYDHVIKL